MGFINGFIEYPDGVKVRYRVNEHQKGVSAVFVHDVGESLDDYDFLFTYFEANGISLHAIELRGHGGSSSGKNAMKDYELLSRDLKRFVFGNLANRPLYVIAQGIGALPVLRLALDEHFHIKGLVFLAPVFDLSIGKFSRMMIHVFSKILPQYKIVLLPHFTTVIHRENETDIPRVSGFSLGFYNALIKETYRAQKNLPLIRIFPTLLIRAEGGVFGDYSLERIFKNSYGESELLKVVVCRNGDERILKGRDRIEHVERISKWIIRCELNGELRG